MLEILDVGIADPNDLIEYPDERVTFKKAEGKAYRDGKVLANWSSDPNL